MLSLRRRFPLSAPVSTVSPPSSGAQRPPGSHKLPPSILPTPFGVLFSCSVFVGPCLFLPSLPFFPLSPPVLPADLTTSDNGLSFYSPGSPRFFCSVVFQLFTHAHPLLRTYFQSYCTVFISWTRMPYCPDTCVSPPSFFSICVPFRPLPIYGCPAFPEFSVVFIALPIPKSGPSYTTFPNCFPLPLPFFSLHPSALVFPSPLPISRHSSTPPVGPRPCPVRYPPLPLNPRVPPRTASSSILPPLRGVPLLFDTECPIFTVFP